MGPIGIPEMLFILVIALVIFGPKRLPEFGRTIGKALGEFRRATSELKRSIDVEMTAVEPASRATPAAVEPASTVARKGADDPPATETADLDDEVQPAVDGDEESG